MTGEDRGTAGTRTLRVLLVEDSRADAELTTEILSRTLPGSVVQHAVRLDEALGLVAQGAFDVALVDLELPDAEGLEALRALRAAAPDLLPVVVLTGRDEDRSAHAALAAGAQDYLVKEQLTGDRLARAVRYAVSRARAEQEAARSRRWAQSVLDSIEAPTCAVDASGTLVAVNAAWTRFALENGGDPDATGVGANYLAACERAGDTASLALAGELRRLFETGSGRVEREYAAHTPDQQRWFSLRATPAVGGAAAVLTHLDVTGLRLAHDQLDHAATHDPLTGLANRRLLVQELDRRLATARPGRVVVVMFIDLDRFKIINDTFGHTAGDGVLVRVAAELTAAVRQGDLVSRHGGDEFVVVLDAAEHEVGPATDRIHAATSRRLRVLGADIDVGASVGLVVSPAGAAATGEDLLRAVDDAMHEAKQRGRGRVELYGDDLRERARVRAQLYKELRVAVDTDQFVLHFQPIVVPDVGGMHAVEALVRWQHPERGLLAPDEFLDAAEATGLIVPLGVRVLQEACAQGQVLHEAGLHLSVTVNLSARQLNDPGTEAVLAEALATSGFPAHSLILEVTETTMIDDTDTALASMRAIKALGVQLAVDDFGTGYSSMSYIKRYPVDGIKIDRSFVRDVLTSSDDRAIVASQIKLARDLDLWVVAEGVETREQLAVLREMGCELVQGFLYARPMPPEELLHTAALLSSSGQVGVPAPRAVLVQGPSSVDPAVLARMLELGDAGWGPDRSPARDDAGRRADW